MYMYKYSSMLPDMIELNFSLSLTRMIASTFYMKSIKFLEK